MIKMLGFIFLPPIFFLVLVSKPLGCIFLIITMSLILSFFFFLKANSLLSLIWVMVYLGGMMIIFTYLVFMVLSLKIFKDKPMGLGLFLFFLLFFCKNLMFFLLTPKDTSGGSGIFSNYSYLNLCMSFLSLVILSITLISMILILILSTFKEGKFSNFF